MEYVIAYLVVMVVGSVLIGKCIRFGMSGRETPQPDDRQVESPFRRN